MVQFSRLFPVPNSIRLPFVKQFSAPFERNKEPILAVLRTVLPPSGLVLEIGSGSGQHAVWFSTHFPGLQWQPSDRGEALASSRAWQEEAALDNLLPPVELDLLASEWPLAQVDAVVCINTIHIVSWEGVQRLFAGVGRALRPGGVFFVYGPYRYADRPLEPSNEEFDRWLKQRDPVSGIRDFEAVDALAREAGLVLEGDQAMPANNRSIWWRKPA
jgi:SAM-dependent methyltransferase